VRVPESENNLIELNLRKDSPAVGKRVVDLELPKSALLVFVRRRAIAACERLSLARTVARRLTGQSFTLTSIGLSLTGRT
jgi:NhaP-type Na+/H+ and K+/H+ antiporter